MGQRRPAVEGVELNTPFWQRRRVFVTGHTGFKGSWLCLWLAANGAEVIGYADGIPTQPSLFEAAELETAMTSLRGDVRDRGLLRNSLRRYRPEIVFHLAAQSLVRRSLANPVRTFETNVLGTVNLLDGVRAIDDVRVVVNVTTDKVYAESGGTRLYAEDDPLGGSDPYSTSKACSELVTDAYRQSFFDSEKVALATARSGNVLGGGDWAKDRLVPDVVAALIAGQPVEIRYPDAVRPWQHVLSALEGYLRLAERLWDDETASGAWNFGPAPAEALPVGVVVKRLAAHWGSDLKVIAPSIPQPPEAAVLQLDASQARLELGWEPHWDLEQTLGATAAWYRGYADGASARELTCEQIRAYESSCSVPAPTP
jgi:CDP-glucose 4,6-dehydratase